MLKEPLSPTLSQTFLSKLGRGRGECAPYHWACRTLSGLLATPSLAGPPIINPFVLRSLSPRFKVQVGVSGWSWVKYPCSGCACVAGWGDGESKEGGPSSLSFWSVAGGGLSPTKANSVYSLDVGGSNVKQPTKDRSLWYRGVKCLGF